MKIIYMHHAERDKSSDSEWGSFERTFDDITEIGKKQAELLAQSLKKEKISAIISSPYLRCMNTAKIINKYHNLDIKEDSRFNEIQKGEEWLSLLNRNIEAIDEIVKTYSDDDVILCVTSGVNISAFICYFYNIEPSNDVPWSQARDISPVIFNIKKQN